MPGAVPIHSNTMTRGLSGLLVSSAGSGGSGGVFAKILSGSLEKAGAPNTPAPVSVTAAEAPPTPPPEKPQQPAAPVKALVSAQSENDDQVIAQLPGPRTAIPVTQTVPALADNPPGAVCKVSMRADKAPRHTARAQVKIADKPTSQEALTPAQPPAVQSAPSITLTDIGFSSQAGMPSVAFCLVRRYPCRRRAPPLVLLLA